MQRTSLLILTAIFIFSSSYECNRSKSTALRGKLVIKELCSHYVVQVIEGAIDTSLVENNWRDEKRQKTFDKVFTVANKCTFPSELNEGDEFVFTIDSNPPAQNCMVCLAFYPTPGKTNLIKLQQAK